eukprot:Tamp_02902.p1 GENE.Tamp_02902~~Tamp_02902.p1  ORF type:complete len:1275 (+),score=395.64 Tamp_02902:191-3826(+)
MAHNLSEKTANEAKLQRQVHPIQKELSRMVRENNQLHLELIQRGEILDTHQRKSALDTKKLQTKITDQAFIITQQAQHIRDLEKQLDEHRARMQQLLDPNFTCTSGPAGDVIPKGQDIMVSACPRPHETEDDHGEAAVAQVVHDLDSSTAQQIAMLEEELQESRKTQEALEHDVLAMQDAIRNRENEITRMGRLLVTNVNSDKEDLERINAGNEDIIRRLETQLDFVSGQLADAERQKLQVQELAEEVENLRAREAKLESMLLSANAEVQELRALLQQPAGPARTGGGVPTPAKAGPGGEVHQTVGPAPEEAAREGQHNHAGRTDVDAANRKRLELRIGELEVALEERDADCMKLREQMLLGDQRLSENEAKCEQVGMELAEMKRLRDNLYAVVWDFENQMAEVQVKIKDLVSAREEKARQCSQAMDKVRSLQEQLAKASSGAGSSHAHAQQVSQLLDELSEYRERVQDLEAQVERADHELAAWAANDTSNGESSNSAASNVQMLSLRNEINGLKTSLSASEREVQSVRAQLQKVTSENQELSSHMEPMESKLAEKERAIEQLQSLMSNMDETRGQVVSQLKVHMESSQTSKQQSELLEAEVKRLLGELRRYEDELARQKTAVTDVDGERDALLNQLDEKTQMVRTLEGRLSEALKDQHTSLADVTSVQQQADMLRQALNERDAQYKALQMDLRDEMQQRSGAEQLCNAKMEEARVLAADLSTMTRENQVVNDEMAAVVAQRDALKRDLDEALQRLTVSQQMVQAREKERQDILMSYRALNEEKQRSDTGTNRVAMELHQVRAQVYAREEELMRARETISALEQEQQRMAIDMQGLQRHSDLTSEKLLEAHDRSKQDAIDKEAVNRELASCKNVMALVERQKHDAVREGALLRDEIVALRGKVSNVSAEKDLLRSAVEAEKSKVRELEDLLQAMRAKEHAAVNAEQAAVVDSVGLHQRLQTALNENEKNVQELRLLRSRREELEYELEKHRRLVSHESMDKDSATSELGTLKANVRELHFVVEQQNSALQAKQEEIALQRDRLLKIQAEAEANERRVRELDTKLRMSEDANKAMEVSARQHSSSLEQHTTEKDELRSALRRTEEQLDKMHSQYKQVKDNEKHLEIRMSELTTAKAAAETQRDRLEAELEHARATLVSKIKEVETVTELLDKMDHEYRELQGKFLQEHHDAAPHTPAPQTPAARSGPEDDQD